MASKKDVRAALAGLITGERPRNPLFVQRWIESKPAQEAAKTLADGLRDRNRGVIYPYREPRPLYPIGGLPPL